MKRKALCLSSVALTMALGIAIPLRAQAPPVEPSDFSTEFVGGADQNTLLALFEGTVPEPSKPSLEKGSLYVDFTKQRVRVDFMDLDGTPRQTVVEFVDKQRQYVYDIGANTCQASSLPSGITLPPLFGWLANAKPSPHKDNAVLLYGGGIGGPVKLDRWEYRPPHGSGFAEMDLTVSDNPANTPIFLEWRLDHPDRRIEVDFNNFKSGAPDSAVFNLPAVCVI